MQKSYLSKKELELFNRSQQSVSVSYQHGHNDVEDAIVMQSIDVLNDYVKGELLIANADIAMLEQMAKGLLHKVKGAMYQKVFVLYQKVKESAKKIKEEEQKYANFAKVVSLLNNKKQAREMSMENLMLAKKTIEADTQHSPKQKQRAIQQLQSYALTKYAEMKQVCDKNFEPYKKFVSAYNFAYQKTAGNLGKVKAELKNTLNQGKESVKKKSSFNIFTSWANHIKAGFQSMKHMFKKIYYKYEPAIAVGSLLVISLVGWKAIKTTEGGSGLRFAPQTEVSKSSAKAQEAAQTIHFDEARQKSVQKQQAKPSNSSSKTTVEKDYYDTALQIHLGSKEAVQNLYNQIDNLAQSGKIKLVEGLSVKRYAHSFTMYNLIRPNSAENKAIQNLLAGGNENPDLINRLVMKAQAKGEGVRPDNNSVKTSNFDNANLSLQIQHLKNLQAQR